MQEHKLSFDGSKNPKNKKLQKNEKNLEKLSDVILLCFLFLAIVEKY